MLQECGLDIPATKSKHFANQQHIKHISCNHMDVHVFLPVPKWHYTILHQTVLRSSHVDMLLTREDAPRQSLRLSQAASTSDNTWVDDKTSRKNHKYKSNVSPRIHDTPSVSLHS